MTLFLDNEVTRKPEVILEGWGDLVDGVCAEEDGVDLPEVDRQLSGDYLNDLDDANVPRTCPQVTVNSVDDDSQPVYVVKGNVFEVQAEIEQNQRVILAYQLKVGDEEVGSTVYKALSGVEKNGSCESSTGNDVPTSDGQLIQRFSDTCTLTYTFEFPEGSGQAVGADGNAPSDNYVFRLYAVDLAGNLSVEVEDNSTGFRYDAESGETTALNNDASFVQSTSTESLQIYHDTREPVTPSLNLRSEDINSPVTGSQEIGSTGDVFTRAITKSLEVVGSHSGEQQSDMGYQWLRVRDAEGNAVSEATQERLLVNGYDVENNQKDGAGGDGETRLPLGTQGDQRDGCVRVSNSPTFNRAVGTCADGVYRVDVESTDTAGNTSAEVSRIVERDTVQPNTPTLTLSKTGPDQFEEYLGVQVSGGEGLARADITVTNPGLGQTFYFSPFLDAGGNYSASDMIGDAFACGRQVYTVTVRLVDRAGNVSSQATETITTGDCAQCFTAGGTTFINPIQVAGRGNYTSYYNVPRGDGKHAGIDINVNIGDNILAVYDGQVVANTAETDGNGNLKGWGYYMILAHTVNDQSVYSIYAHMNEPSSLAPNTPVTQGMVIGKAGNTGWSTGPHLHLQIQVVGAPIPDGMGAYTASGYGAPVNPLLYLPTQNGNVDATLQTKYCPGDGTGNGGVAFDDEDHVESAFPHVDKQNAVNSLYNYLENELRGYSEIESWKQNEAGENYKSTIQVQDMQQVPGDPEVQKKRFIADTTYTVCGGKVWVMLMEGTHKNPNATHNPDGEGYDGILVVNGFQDPTNPTTYLVKNGIYEKYAGDGESRNWTNQNMCKRIGAPNSEEKEAYVGNKSAADNTRGAWYHTFDYGITHNNSVKYNKNSIYAYYTKPAMNGYTRFASYYSVAEPGQEHWDSGGTQNNNTDSSRRYDFPIRDAVDVENNLSEIFVGEFADTGICQQRFFGYTQTVNLDYCRRYRNGSGLERSFFTRNINASWNSNNIIYPKTNPNVRESQILGIQYGPGDSPQGIGNSETWIVIHGWNRDPRNTITFSDMYLDGIGQRIAELKPNATVLSLNWKEAATAGESAYNPGLPTGVKDAARWIKPVARDSYTHLNRWGLTDNTKVNFVGHSLGTIMSTEIARLYNEYKASVTNSAVMLDPASQLTTQVGSDLWGYDIDGNTPGPQTPQAAGDTAYFRNQFRFSRGFTGTQSVAGNLYMTKTAHEAYLMDFYGPGSGLGKEHEDVWKTFENMNINLQSRFKENWLTILDTKPNFEFNEKNMNNGYNALIEVTTNESRIPLERTKVTQINKTRSGNTVEINGTETNQSITAERLYNSRDAVVYGNNGDDVFDNHGFNESVGGQLTIKDFGNDGEYGDVIRLEDRFGMPINYSISNNTIRMNNNGRQIIYVQGPRSGEITPDALTDSSIIIYR